MVISVSPPKKVITRKKIRLYDRANSHVINYKRRCFDDTYFVTFELPNVDKNWIKKKLTRLCDKYIPRITIKTANTTF